MFPVHQEQISYTTRKTTELKQHHRADSCFVLVSSAVYLLETHSAIEYRVQVKTQTIKEPMQ